MTTIYSDISLNGRGKVVANEDSIFQAVTNVLLTNKRERFFNSSFGSDLGQMLFTQIDPFELEMMKSQLAYIIKSQEPRIKDIKIQITGKPEQNKILLEFSITTDYGDFAKTLLIQN